MKSIWHRWAVVLVAVFCMGGAFAQTARTKVELISSVSAIEPGKSFEVGIRLKMPEGWHTYWVNAGDSGIPTEVVWTLPEGFIAGAIQWPIPERIEALPLVTYGYEKEVVLFTTMTPPANLKVGSKVVIEGEIRWLECKETCIPGKAMVSLNLPVKSAVVPQSDPQIKKLLEDFRVKVPVEEVAASVEMSPDKSFHITIQKAGIRAAQFFPITEGKVALAVPFTTKVEGDLIHISGVFEEASPLLAGVVVMETDQGQKIAGFKTEVKMVGKVPSVKMGESPKSLGFILFLAFVGGLILNLMPCVLPVLSLKILGFVHDAQGERSQAWKQGVAFTGGVMVSVWVLTGILLALRYGGEGLGWGFQLQSPGFILAMILLFLGMTLNLFGVFEFGASLASLQNQVSEKEGWMKSFGSGVLATIVATPCSAPFMGAAVGYALSQSVGVTLLVMSFLGLGVAAPYLILSLKPQWIRNIPKPGEWMIGFKQFLGFLMLATVLWLIWVYAQLQGIAGLGSILMACGIVSFALWCWGRTEKISLRALVLLVAGGVVWQSLPVAQEPSWEKFSTLRVEQLRKEGKPVFINFTAAWCLTCQVNKKLVLHREDVLKAFHAKGVVLMEADWTNSDPEITKALESFGRASVPLYVLYGRDSGRAPEILPEILTREILLRALEGI